MKRTLSSVAAAAMILGTFAPSAFAATSSTTNYSDIAGNFAATQIQQLTKDGYIHGFSDGTFRPSSAVTRGQLLAYFMNAVETVTGVTPGANSQTYSDVAPGNWAFNYVGAASGAGWLNPYWIGVRPGYAFHENYQASWGDAASFFVSAMKQAGKVTLATGQSPMQFLQASGLLQGIPAADQPAQNKYMDRADAAVFLSNVLAWSNGQLLPAGSTVTVTGTTYVAPGSTDQLNVVVKGADGSTITLPSTANVQWSVDNNNGFFNPNVSGQLVTTQAGTYNVTATVDGVASSQFAVNAYGAMTGIVLTPATANVVANGASTDLLTATAVDAKGNTVSNFNGTGTVTVSGSGTSYPSTGQASDFTSATSGGTTTYSVNFVNGVATFDVLAGTIPGLSSTYTVSSTPVGASTAVTGNATVTTVPQTATALKVTAPSPAYVAANSATQTNFSVEVVDQTGNPMLNGSWSYNVAVSGPGSLQTASTGVFYGNGTTTPNGSTVTVQSEQGVTGAITVTVSGTGLTSSTATVNSVVAQTPVKFVPSSTTTSFAQGSNAAVSIMPVDANGYPATWPAGPFTMTVTNSSGSTVGNMEVNNTVVPTGGLSLSTLPSSGSSNSSFNLSFNDSVTNAADAGTYTVTIKDANGNVWASFPVVETAAAASKLSVSTPATYVTQAGAANVPVTVQLQDQFGNNVAQANVPVTMYVTTVKGTGSATVNGSAATSSSTAVTVNTNASGVASFTVNAQPYPNTEYQFNAGAASINSNDYTANVTVQSDSVSSVTVGLENTSSGNFGSSYATAGQTVTGWVYLKDAFGNFVNNAENVSLTVPSNLSNFQIVGGQGATTTSTGSPYTVNVTTGQFEFTATAGTAGVATVSASDTSYTPNVSGSASMTVSPAAANAGYAFFNAAGQEITSSNELSVAANTPVEVWLKPVDVAGNPGINTEPGSAMFTDNGANGAFRLSTSGLDTANTAVSVGTSAIPVWYINSTAGNYNLSASSWVASGYTQTNANKSIYSATLMLNGTAASINPQEVTVTGYTYTSGALASGMFTVTGSGSSVTLNVYSNSATFTNPTIGYNGAY